MQAIMAKILLDPAQAAAAEQLSLGMTSAMRDLPPGEDARDGLRVPARSLEPGSDPAPV